MTGKRCACCCDGSAGKIAANCNPVHAAHPSNDLDTAIPCMPIHPGFAARIIESGRAAQWSSRDAAGPVALLTARDHRSRKRYQDTAERNKKSGTAKHGSPVLVTENLMSLSRRGSIIAALFPKEQVPASTPIPPREVGTIFL